VVIFTSSREPADVNRSYQLGVNAYVVKPTGFQEFSETLDGVGRFWAKLNELAQDSSNDERKTPVNPSEATAVMDQPVVKAA
jgi:AmiR/NasT family two-component response regulator